MKNDSVLIAIYSAVIMGFIVLIWCLFRYGDQYTEHMYSLSELNDGVYAIYYNTHSRVPAYNYEVITVCIEGNVYTFKGDVRITFTDDEPYADVKDYNTVYGDKIHVYVPKGTVIYEESVNIGK